MDPRFIQAQVRSAFGTISFILFTINLNLLPMTFIIIIFQTNPLWSAILGFIINKELVRSFELVAMLLSFSCVIMIAVARSSSASDESSADEATPIEPSTDNNGLWLGVFLCLCHAWLFSGVGVISRRLQNVHFIELMLHQAVQGVIIISAVLIFMAVVQEDSMLGDLTARQVWILIGGCLADSLALISMCIAFQAANTSVVCMVGYISIVYAIITDVCFFGETLSVLELVGCAAVLVITVLVGWARSRCPETAP